MTNASPSSVFDRLLAGGHGARSGDWYAEVAPDAYQALYEGGRSPPSAGAFPFSDRSLTSTSDDDAGGRGPPRSATSPTGQRAALKRALGGGGGRSASARRPPSSPGRWPRRRPSAGAPALVGADAERALWRLLRIGSAPTSCSGPRPTGSLRLRIGTAWDWRQHFRIVDVRVTAAGREQPVVDWAVTVAGRRTAAERTVEGHVEVRWSHGKFAQFPEAKVYLDTPHAQVPGTGPWADRLVHRCVVWPTKRCQDAGGGQIRPSSRPCRARTPARPPRRRSCPRENSSISRPCTISYDRPMP